MRFCGRIRALKKGDRQALNACPPCSFSLYGSGAITGTAEAAARRSGLDREVVQSLMDLYGTRYKDVLKLIEKDSSLKEKVSATPIVIKAQLVYSVETEMARTVEDITDRRLSPVSEKIFAAISSVLAGVDGGFISGKKKPFEKV